MGGRLGMKTFDQLVGLLCINSDFIDRVEHIFHIFRCPLYIFATTAETMQHFVARTPSDYHAWEHWTTGSCDVTWIDTSTPRRIPLRFHADVVTKLWREFGRLSGAVSPVSVVDRDTAL